MLINRRMSAGLLVRREARRNLMQLKQAGLLGSWEEEKGILDSMFYLYDLDHRAWSAILEWIDKVNAD